MITSQPLVELFFNDGNDELNNLLRKFHEAII